MTKTALRELARRSTRYGYFDYGATLAVDCPQCRTHVTVCYSMWATDGKGRRLSKIAQLRAAVLEHLTHDCTQVSTTGHLPGGAP